MIYVVSDGRYAKIGYTGGEVGKRMATLQTGTVAKLTVLGQFRGEREDERRLHAEFAHARVAGEWFDLTVEQVGDLIRRESGAMPVERTFSREGMSAVIVEAVNRGLRDVGFSLLTTLKPGETTIYIGSGVSVCSFCERARDEVVQATIDAVIKRKLPDGCSALAKVYDSSNFADGLTCKVAVSSPVYDLTAAAPTWIAYDAVEGWKAEVAAQQQRAQQEKQEKIAKEKAEKEKKRLEAMKKPDFVDF